MSPSSGRKAGGGAIRVNLDASERALLDRVAKKAGISQAEVMRRGLRRIGAELLAEENPFLVFLAEMDREPWPPDMPTDISERHDHYLAEIYADLHEPR